MEIYFRNKMISYFDIISFFQKKKFVFLFRPFLGYLGSNTAVIKPLRIKGLKNIYIHSNATIQNGTWLEALPLTGESCKLVIGEGSTVGHFNHIYATNEIVIGKNVLIADKVYIADNQHHYDDINIPIMKQPIKQLSEIYIGDNSWIGECVSIIGSSIGVHCVIGANSVVTKNIPDYCVAVGAPARIIKRYDFDKNIWRRTDKDGNFIEE
jgi:acetyltransferase-like isoleucine patch superfamily enzyme